MVEYQDMIELRRWMADVITLERQMVELLEHGQQELSGYPEAAAALQRYGGMARAQAEALQERLLQIGGGARGSTRCVSPLGTVTPFPYQEDPYPASRILHVTCTAFNHAAFAYAMLHTVAHRSNHRLGRGDAAGMASHHQRSYLAASEALYRLFPDVVIAEMGQEPQCQCNCPSCGLGICLCWHSHIESFMPASPAEQGGILVRTPRSDSPASRAGLRKGDVILAAGADSQDVHHYRELLAEIRKHGPGEPVHLRVLRGPGDVREISISTTEACRR